MGLGAGVALLLAEAGWAQPFATTAALRGHQAIFYFSSGVIAARKKHGWASSTPREGRA